jgi:hypothetical protein
MTKIIFLGSGSLIKGLIPLIAQKTGVNCELFAVNETEQDPLCTIKNGNLITPINVISASATLPVATTVDYNLMQKEFISQDSSLLLKQLILLVVLTMGLFATLITHYIIQTNKLKKAVYSAEQEALSALKEKFSALEDAKVLDDEVIEEANQEAEEQQKRWFAFSNQSRASFLQYLLELSSKIDRKSIDFKVDQITIAEGVLTLKAEVRDSDALKVFERQLEQSKMLRPLESPEIPQFTMRLTLVGNEEPS